jgi:hypothetical protein
MPTITYRMRSQYIAQQLFLLAIHFAKVPGNVDYQKLLAGQHGG